MFLGMNWYEFYQIYIELIKALLLVLVGMILYRFSVLNRLRDEKLVKKQACTDPLTGGGNRTLFLKEIDYHIKKGKKFALCFFDLDGFKQINDTMGHDAGDELLRILYKMLQDNLPKNASAYRLGGDEFAIIMANIETTEDITNILDNIKKELTKPIVIENTTISLEYSLGVSIFPTDAKDRKELLSYADDAMYYVKENGKNNYYFHNKALKAKYENKNKMEIDLKRAYENNEFNIEFQPRIDLKDRTKIAFEALTYWNHPTLGYLKAEYFINQAEDLGLIIKLDEMVLKKCIEKLNKLKQDGYNNVTIAVNMSNLRARRTDFVDNLCTIAKEHEFSKGEIQIEFTDVVNVKYIENYKIMFEKLKNVGFTIAITNIETKYEILTLLKELPVDELKINVKYLSEKDKFNEQIIRDIIKLGKDLKYMINVTHIDRESEFKEIINNDVDSVQGNYFFKRIKIENIDSYMKDYLEYMKNTDKIIKNTNSKI